MRARFAREAKAAAGLRNKHIVDVPDYGLDGEVPYLVMELLTGEDLGTRLAREKRLSIQATATLVAQVAKALRGAHELGLVHRDLKPLRERGSLTEDGIGHAMRERDVRG